MSEEPTTNAGQQQPAEDWQPPSEKRKREIAEMKVAFCIKLFRPREDVPEEMNTTPTRDVFSFRARWLHWDVSTNVAQITDELAMNPAVYAEYRYARAQATRMQLKASYELKRTKRRVEQRLREKATPTDPNVPPVHMTEGAIKMEVELTPSVAALSEIVADLDYAVEVLDAACSSLYMKQQSLQEIAKGLRGEAYLTGQTTVRELAADAEEAKRQMMGGR